MRDAGWRRRARTLDILDLELQLGLPTLYCCEDAHAQGSRLLLAPARPRRKPRDLWIADRNFCTTAFLAGLAQRKAAPSSVSTARRCPGRSRAKRKRVGRIDEGAVYEQRPWPKDARAVETGGGSGGDTVLDKPTCDGDTEIHLITNLPSRAAAKRVGAGLPRGVGPSSSCS